MKESFDLNQPSEKFSEEKQQETLEADEQALDDGVTVQPKKMYDESSEQGTSSGDEEEGEVRGPINTIDLDSADLGIDLKGADDVKNESEASNVGSIDLDALKAQSHE